MQAGNGRYRQGQRLLCFCSSSISEITTGAKLLILKTYCQLGLKAPVLANYSLIGYGYDGTMMAADAITSFAGSSLPGKRRLSGACRCRLLAQIFLLCQFVLRQIVDH